VANQLLIATPQGSQWAAAAGNLGIGPFTIAGGLGLAEEFTLTTMANGDNTFAVPASSVGCVIIFPVGNNTVVKVRTVGGDTGIQVPKTGSPTVILFDTAALPASVIINSAGGFAGPLTVIFF
jgi:hypothetical protein